MWIYLFYKIIVVIKWLAIIQTKFYLIWLGLDKRENEIKNFLPDWHKAIFMLIMPLSSPIPRHIYSASCYCSILKPRNTFLINSWQDRFLFHYSSSYGLVHLPKLLNYPFYNLSGVEKSAILRTNFFISWWYPKYFSCSLKYHSKSFSITSTLS